jgi:hypothetical protein
VPARKLLTPVVSGSVRSAAAAAEQHWAREKADQLTFLKQPSRKVVAELTQSAAARDGNDWAIRFAARISGFALWTGLVFASAIGAVRWATEVRVLHWPAAATAAAYLVALVVAFPECWTRGRRVWSHLTRISSRAGRHFLVLYPTFMTSMAILYGIVNAAAFRPLRHPSASLLPYLLEFLAFAAATGLGTLLAYGTLAYAYSGALEMTDDPPAVKSTWMLAATALTAWLPASRTRPGNARLDSGLLHILGCAAALDDLAGRQDPLTTSGFRSVISALDLAAADLELYAVDRVPRSDAPTRRIARQYGARLATVVQDAKVAVACAASQKDLGAVAADLAGFLVAWAQSDAGGLGAIGDEAQVTSTPVWRRVATRIWSALLLFAAGSALPFLPYYHANPQAAAGLRYALFTAAVMALATGTVRVWDTIDENLQRTLPGA